MAMGLSALAIGRALAGRHASAGWLIGGAIAMQLYAVALLPVILGLIGLRRSAQLLGRAAVIPGAILLAVLIPNPHATLQALLDQANFPPRDHPTPWVLVAPALGPRAVAAGPGRFVGLAIACGLGVVAARCRSKPVGIVWLAGCALGLRCLFESVMDPYYVGPAIGLALVAMAGRRWRHVAVAVTAAVALTLVTYGRPGIWWYWSEMAVAMAVLFAAASPWRVPFDVHWARRLRGPAARDGPILPRPVTSVPGAEHGV